MYLEIGHAITFFNLVDSLYKNVFLDAKKVGFMKCVYKTLDPFISLPTVGGSNTYV